MLPSVSKTTLWTMDDIVGLIDAMKRWWALRVGTLFSGRGRPEVPMAAPADDATGERFVAPSAGKAALYLVATRLVSIAPIMVGRANVGSLMDHTWIRVDVASGRYDVTVVGPHNNATRTVHLAAGSTYFIEVTFTNEIPPVYRLKEMSDDAGRVAILAGKRVHAAVQPTITPTTSLRSR